MNIDHVSVWNISKSDFLAFRHLLKNPNYFSDSYDDWLMKVEGFGKEMRFRGEKTRQVKIECHAFTTWCSAKQLKPDSKKFRRYLRHAHLLGRAPAT